MLRCMPSLHIEHAITDLPTWTAAFTSLANIRRSAGVMTETVRHPFDDDRYVVIDLEFDTTEHATAFRDFLETQIWANPANSPALAGRPVTRILESIESLNRALQ